MTLHVSSIRLTFLVCLMLTMLTGCPKRDEVKEALPVSNADPKAATEPPAKVTKPLDALQDICYRRNVSQTLARKSTVGNRTAAKKAYEELQASGNAYVDTLAVSVRNKQSADLSRYATGVSDDVLALRSVVEASHAGAFPSWYEPLLSLAEKVFIVAVGYSKDKREAFAKDLQTTCRWDDFDRVHPLPKP